MRSDIGFPLSPRWTAGRDAFDQWRADFRTPLATVVQHEQHDRLQAGEIGAIDDRTADAARGDEFGPRQHGQMGGHRVLGNGECLGYLAGSKPLRLVLDQQPEDLQREGRAAIICN